MRSERHIRAFSTQANRTPGGLDIGSVNALSVLYTPRTIMQPNVQTLHAAAVESSSVVALCLDSVPGSPTNSTQGEGLHSSPSPTRSKSVGFATTVVKVDEFGLECFQPGTQRVLFCEEGGVTH